MPVKGEQLEMQVVFEPKNSTAGVRLAVGAGTPSSSVMIPGMKNYSLIGPVSEILPLTVSTSAFTIRGPACHKQP